MNYRMLKTSLLAGAALSGAAFSGVAQAQSTPEDDSATTGDIIVTAQRVEQRLQDVPISITVFNQDQLTQRNVAVASDLATYTPSLSVNTRYGPEKATFAIRGFNQDAAAAPSVGVYFADVVGIRAQGGTASGNSAMAGAFSDLQNVQVLKGPQGTLFGRNTTGGSVLLVPTKPTDELKGYVEGTYGNYDQKRVQAALNVPLADTFKIRVSVDRNSRDGYMINHSGIGPKDYNDVNYFYGRFSMVADLTPDLENYTIFHYSRSHTNGYANRLESCDRNPGTDFANPVAALRSSVTRYYLSLAACAQIDRQAARGDGPLDVEVNNPDPSILIKQWQAINTTTWRASDTLTVKNIVSYGVYTEDAAFSLYSDNFFIPDTAVTRANALRAGPVPGSRFQYIRLGKQPGYHASAESTLTEELQFQGNSADGKLNYVVGGYLEFSRPFGWNQQRTGIYGNCVDPGTLDCVGAIQLIPISAAASVPGVVISQSRTKLSFDNHGIFGQATYKFTDQLALTVGGRWTFDKIDGYEESARVILATIPGVGTRPVNYACNDSLNHGTVNLLTNGGDLKACGTRIVAKSNKPTWLIDLDFKPTPDMLFYAKWARGYRQGAVNFTNPGLETVGPEKVDTYELGAKLTFRGALPGYFNIAGFYNDFTDQQIFGALVAKPTSGIAGGAALINAGKSVLKGIEVDTAVTVADVLHLSAGYTYLDTKLKALVVPTLSPDSPFQQIIPRGNVGGPLTFSPKHKLTLGADLNMPLGDAGEFNAGAVYVYTAKQTVDGNRSIPSYSLISLNAGISKIGGTGLSVVAFANNVTNKHYRVTSGGGFDSSGILDFAYGQPRMYGVRVKYAFGGN